MRAGDLLLIKHKFDPLSWLIRKVTKSEWNHIAWAMNGFWLIEAKGCGIVMSPIRKFQNKRLYDIKLIRLKNLSKPRIKKVSKLLYDQRCRWPYWKFLLTYILSICGCKRRPCKSCSWFIAEALRSRGYRVGKNNPRYVAPRDFAELKEAQDVTEEICCGCPGL